MKRNFTTLMLQLGILVALGAQSKEPALIVEAYGQYYVVTSSMDTIKPYAGTSVSAGAMLHVQDGAVLVYHNDAFTRYELPGKYPIEEEELNSAAFLTFDPLFGEYLKANMATISMGIDNGAWAALKDPLMESGWGTDKTGPEKGWGSATITNVKGWGTDKTGPDKGWGTDKTGPEKGWGSATITNVKGWGTDKTGPDKGWGELSATTMKGWALKNAYFPESGWGSLWRVKESGWGTDKTGPDKGWGLLDPTKAIGWGTDKTKPDKGWGTDKTGPAKGWTRADMSLLPAEPGGLYHPAPLKIHWDADPRTDRYLVVIINMDGEVVQQTETPTNKAVIHLQDLPNGETFYWQAFAHGVNAISPPTFFRTIDQESSEGIGSSFENSEIYHTSNPALQGLMRATAYEHYELFLECHREYQNLMKMYPRNDLVKFCYAGYLQRAGLFHEIGTIF